MAETVTLYWLGLPVELPAVEYAGSQVKHHGVYGLDGWCDEHPAGETCDGSVLISPTTGVRLVHVRDRSWTRRG